MCQSRIEQSRGQAYIRRPKCVEMRDIWKELTDWAASGRSFAWARVIETWGSAPREVGSAMIVDQDM